MNRRDCLRALCFLPIAIPLGEVAPVAAVIDLMDWPNTLPLKEGGSFTVPCGMSGSGHRQVAFLLRPGEIVTLSRMREDQTNTPLS